MKPSILPKPHLEQGCISTLHMWQPCVKLGSDGRGARDGVQRPGRDSKELQLYLLHRKNRGRFNRGVTVSSNHSAAKPAAAAAA